MSCTVLKNPDTNAIVTIDGTPVTTEELLYVYHKNNLETQTVDTSEIRNYLDLFINFKLKVREAEMLGLDQDSAFIEELEGYRKQLAYPYLTETRLLDSLAKVTYERLKTEINASHILIQVTSDASPQDTLAAYEEIVLLSDLIKQGEDFGQVAFERSEDPSVKQNKGNLGYFTAMQMVYPFEEAAYRLPVDSISQPVRTNFGYHLIKVHDKRTSQGQIQVSHILVRTQQGISPSDSILAANRAQEIYSKAINQEDWDLLCRQFSEDVGTKMKGGKLPWFKTGDISNIPAFEKAAFSLDQIGEISEPVKTEYGWHIIKLEEQKELETYETLEPKIRSNISANSRAEMNQQELIKRLKKENHFKESRQVVEEAISYANETLSKGTWTSVDHWGIQNKQLFSIDDSSYTVADFYQYVENKQPLPYQSDPVEMMRTAYDKFSKEALIAYEDAHLADKYYDYKMLLKEYRDGILLFQLMEDKVWNQAIQDTLGLKSFFEENQQNYQWEDRAATNIYNVLDENALQEVENFIEQGYFNYTKYDFYSQEESLNKVQINILDDISQLLLQSENKYLILQYDTSNSRLEKICGEIINHLQTIGIDTNSIVIEELNKGSLGFIGFVASNSIDDLSENMNNKNPLTIQVESGLFQKGENTWLDQVAWETGRHQLEVDNRIVLVEITQILPAGNQQFNEIKGQVISDYQTELENEWVEELRNKYRVDIHENELERIYNKYHN